MMRSFLVVLFLAQGCSSKCELDQGTRVFFDPAMAEHDGTPETWLRFPFPSDLRLTDGGLALDDFPNPEGSGELRHFKRTGEAVLDGFSTLAPVYLTFDDAIDITSLPPDPAATASATSPLQLIDVTPGSPEFGERRPVRWQYWGIGDKYIAPSTLAVAAAWGFPLRERTTYALVVTTDVRDIYDRQLKPPPLLLATLGADIEDACTEDVPKALRTRIDEVFAPLADHLADLDLSAGDIAAATVFTTQDITGPLATIRAQVHAAPAPTAGDWQEIGGDGIFHQQLSYQWNGTDTVDYWLLEGRYSSPNYQNGNLPYGAPRDGGGFNTVDGVLAVDHVEQLRLVLTVPVAAPADGGTCYPIVLYAHGTGGDAYGFTDTTGGRLAARGLAAIGIDQPMHGTRDENKGFNIELMSFNYFNAPAARTNLRQSSVDTFVLTRLVRESLAVPAAVSPTGADICFDGTRVSFFGHSHGGLTGAMAAAVETDIPTWVLSGAGGGLSITLMERKDFADFEQLIRLLLYMGDEDEPLSELHPVVGLIQSLVDITDPLNYSPHWLHLSTRGSAAHVLVTSGEHDAATPHRTAAAMAVAGHVPVVEPVVIDIPAYDWTGLASVAAPASANVGGRTAGFLQWRADGADDSHWVIFRRPEAIHASMRFLESAAYDTAPVIERVPGADVR